MTMTLDTRMPSYLMRGDLSLPRPERCSPAGKRTSAALVLALLWTSACTGSSSGGPSGGGGGGDNGSILLTPEGDTFIKLQEELDVALLQPTFELANGTSESLAWEVHVGESWLTCTGPENGTLAAGEAAGITLSVDAYEAGHTGVDPAVAEIVFLQSGTGAVLGTRTVTVESTSVELGNAGWTTFEPSADTRTVFVSSSIGNDGFDGLSEMTPKRTIAAGQSLLRHGFPDWLLLRRGDVWRESLGQWKKSGRAPSEPMLVSTYGDEQARPLLETPGGGIWTNGGGGSPPSIDNLAIVGLHFRPESFNGVGDCTG